MYFNNITSYQKYLKKKSKVICKQVQNENKMSQGIPYSQQNQ